MVSHTRLLCISPFVHVRELFLGEKSLLDFIFYIIVLIFLGWNLCQNLLTMLIFSY
jgi:hypothetical protein